MQFPGDIEVILSAWKYVSIIVKYERAPTSDFKFVKYIICMFYFFLSYFILLLFFFIKATKLDNSIP